MKIQKIVNKKYCLGCGLCVSDIGTDKLTIVENDEGFLVPQCVPGFDGEIPNLRAYCPGITIVLKRHLHSDQEKFYGPFSSLNVAWARDKNTRFKGSSGGALTAILCALVKQGKIDGVLQVGPSKDDPTRTGSFFSTTEKEIITNAGSRYAPVSLLKNFKDVLDRYQKIAVVGKPCDIAAIRQFIDLYPEYADKLYCTFSFMCMGMPSQNATYRLLERLGVDQTACVKSFSYRGNGWPGQASIVTPEKKYSCSYEDSWGRILGRDILFRCKICPDGWGSFADISAGDAWYTDGKGPLFEDQPGRSFLFVRTHRGDSVLSDVSDFLEVEEYNIAELPVIQQSQHARKKRIWSSYLVLKLLGDRMLFFKGLGVWSCVLKCSPLQAIRIILGFARRLP